MGHGKLAVTRPTDQEAIHRLQHTVGMTLCQLQSSQMPDLQAICDFGAILCGVITTRFHIGEIC